METATGLTATVLSSNDIDRKILNARLAITFLSKDWSSPIPEVELHEIISKYNIYNIITTDSLSGDIASTTQTLRTSLDEMRIKYELFKELVGKEETTRRIEESERQIKAYQFLLGEE